MKRVDYTIKKIKEVPNPKYEEIIYITEGKQSELYEGYMQNIMQLDSEYCTNKRNKIIAKPLMMNLITYMV